jgi:glycosyltransferase involved in cell wall biosynthesis
LRMELGKLVKEIRGEDMVFFMGFLEDIPQILKSLDVFVLSSESEGLGSILMNAMACRLPIVAARIGGISELIEHRKTGLLVPPQRPKSLAKAILEIYEDRELASQLGLQGYGVVHQKFSAEAMALKAIDLYEELAKKNGVKLLKSI